MLPLSGRARHQSRQGCKVRDQTLLVLAQFFLFGATRCESGPRLIFVLQHPPEQTTAEGSIKLHLVVAKGGVAKSSKGHFRRRWIAVRQSAEEPHIGDTLNSLWILGANFINRLLQRASVTFPVEEDQPAACLRLSIIRFDR